MNSATPEPVPERARAHFTIVGIGASAGGLAAISTLLRTLPLDTGMAFVVVLHLDPRHDSALDDILSRATAMPVRRAQDQLGVEPNHVYVIPPGKDMTISDGQLRLEPRTETHGQHRSIDHFLSSLAEDPEVEAIGVILSGASTDGTRGLSEIKSVGGITFAQDESAEHATMPRSAIAAGCVDMTLSPEDIAQEIARISRHPIRQLAEDASLTRILEALRHATGTDFSHYKPNTLQRRITRRLLLLKMDNAQAYVRYLTKTPKEAEALYQDILINVTGFFRNPAAYDALKASVFPRLAADRGNNEPVRVWSIACSTGEEAYSLAIAWIEYAQESGRSMPIQIFATDLNSRSIEKARAGVYPKNIAENLSPQRLRQFFVDVDGNYRIAKAIRDMCVFAQQNVLADPPFSHIDLIACRNLLIYLEPVLQRKLLPMLHYSLRQDGMLWLGSSETIGTFRDLFDVQDAKSKIYSKKRGSARSAPPSARTRNASRNAGDNAPHTSPREAALPDPQKEADRIVLARYAPAGVVLNAEFEIVQFRGDTGPYLAPSPGRASLSILKMLREGLLVGVRAALNKAKREQAAVHEDALRVKSSDGPRDINVIVIPLRPTDAAAGAYLLLFEEPVQSAEVFARKFEAQARVLAEHRVRPSDENALGQENARLIQELDATRDYLQSVIEQQEGANEALQSANEEVQSANEELQSINEELETSKEEIQSSNEELATVNDELQHRNVELTHLSNDMINLLGSVQMAIVMLGRDMRIRRFTPHAEKLLNLVAADVGRALIDIHLKIDIPELQTLLLDAIENASTREMEVQDNRGGWFSLRIRPYRTTENQIDGAVMMLVDIADLKRAEEILRNADRGKDDFLALLAHELRNPLAAIRTSQYVLSSARASADQRIRASAITERQSALMERIIEDLLDLSRLAHGKVELRLERLDVRAVVTETIAATEHQRLARRQSLDVSLPDHALDVDADATRLDQIISNLLGNASKFTPEGGHIGIEVRSSDATPASPTAQLEITVRDNGIGIDATALRTIFDSFMQGRTLETTRSGMGLGLALARQLTALHGGTIAVFSEGVGRGAQFVVHLPLVSAG
ncbi:MAG: chemotaxis protein CheB [Dokdonella sp.]